MKFLRIRIDSLSSSSLMLFSVVLLIAPLILHISWAYGNINSWQITEWLISYDGGFVRRGIGGEIVKILSSTFELSPPLIIIILSVISWLALVFFIFQLSRDLIPSYLILSPVFLGMPIYADFLHRKDVLGLLLLAISLLVIRGWSGIGKYVAVNFLLLFGLLNHESIVFYGFPIVILAEIFSNKNFDWKRNISPYFPLLLLVLIVMIYKGTDETTIQISSFWNLFLEKNYAEFCCLAERPAAIDAIGWTTWSGLSLSLGLLNDFANNFIYVPAAWILTIFICLQFGNWSLNRTIGRRFIAIFLIQLFFVSPLFLLGWDFGRWIFFITVSSLLWVSIFREVEISHKYLDYFVNLLHMKPWFTSKELFFFGLIIGVPACCWSLGKVILSSPLGESFYILNKLVVNFQLFDKLLAP